MRTFPKITDKAAQKLYIPGENRIIGLAIISIGAVLIALGPWLAGTPHTLGSWCYHAAAFSAQGLAKQLVWMASQHCGYCYLGAAMIGIGSTTGLRRGS